MIQFALYTLGKEGQGNTNVQLWATDLTIVVPGDQPHSIGMSFGAANMGGIRNVTIKAEGTSGHTGFALVQYNNGPG